MAPIEASWVDTRGAEDNSSARVAPRWQWATRPLVSAAPRAAPHQPSPMTASYWPPLPIPRTATRGERARRAPCSQRQSLFELVRRCACPLSSGSSMWWTYPRSLPGPPPRELYRRAWARSRGPSVSATVGEAPQSHWRVPRRREWQSPQLCRRPPIGRLWSRLRTRPSTSFASPLLLALSSRNRNRHLAIRSTAAVGTDAVRPSARIKSSSISLAAVAISVASAADTLEDVGTPAPDTSDELEAVLGSVGKAQREEPTEG
eukprot:scaffold27521_cov30-Tisochrysis_lutea.AAC.9